MNTSEYLSSIIEAVREMEGNPEAAPEVFGILQDADTALWDLRDALAEKDKEDA